MASLSGEVVETGVLSPNSCVQLETLESIVSMISVAADVETVGE